MDSNDICTALRINGVQCARKRNKNSDYCSSHRESSTKDVSTKDKDPSVGKLAPEHKKQKAAQKTVRHDVEIMDIAGIPYFVDVHKNVFSHETIADHNPVIVGRWSLNAAGKPVFEAI